MLNMFEKLVERYPRLPVLLANTSASKLIQLIKDKAIDPVFENKGATQKIQSASPLTNKTVEWVMYFLSGWVRTMPEPAHPVAIAIQEALAESLTQVGIKVNEISTADRMEIIDAVMPAIQEELVEKVKNDHWFMDRVDAITGSAHDWNMVFQDANDAISLIREKTQTHRTARKARGWRRFLW